MAASLFMQQRINANVNPNPSGPFFFSLEFQTWGSDLIRWRSIACFFWFGLAVLSVVIAALMFGSSNRPSGPTLALATLAFIVTSLLLLSFDLSDMQGICIRSMLTYTLLL